MKKAVNNKTKMPRKKQAPTEHAPEVLPEMPAPASNETPTPTNEAPTSPVKKNRGRKKKSDEASTVSTTSAATTTISKANKKRTKKKSDLPSRTPSNYVLFSIEYRKKVVAEFPDLSLGEVSRRCGEQWKKMSDDDRKPWTEQALKLKNERKDIIDKKNQENPPKKKRTPSSYLLFSVAQRQTILKENPKFSIGEISKLCGEKWRSMSKDEQQPWIDQADLLKKNA